MKYDKNENVSLLLSTIPIKSLPEGKKCSVQSLLLVLRNVTILMHGNLLQATVQMGFFRLKLLVFINTTVQWHMMTHSESTFLSRIFIDSLLGF